MTAAQKKLAIYAGAALLAWLLTPSGRAAVGRVTKTLLINADINDPMFGVADGDFAIDPEMDRLIKESNTAIAADDAAHPEDL